MQRTLANGISRDGCYDTELEVHDVLFAKVFAREATVMTAEQFTHPNPTPPTS
jgi:hypothetical protein